MKGPAHEGRPYRQRACVLPGGFAQIAGGMRGEGRQVGHHRQVSRALAPVTEIVPRVLPVGPGHVEGPVTDPPPCTSAGGDFDDVVVLDVEVGDGSRCGGSPSSRAWRSRPPAKRRGAHRRRRAGAGRPSTGIGGDVWPNPGLRFGESPVAPRPASIRRMSHGSTACIEDDVAACGLDRLAGRPAGTEIATQTDRTQSDH